MYIMQYLIKRPINYGHDPDNKIFPMFEGHADRSYALVKAK